MAEGKDAHVLVVEDDPDIRDAVVEVLRLHGFSPWEAVNGRDGLEKLQRMPRPCIVLLDMMMPVLDGRAFLDQLRNDVTFIALPVVVVSAGKSDGNEKASEWIRKPFHVDELVDVVSRYCGGQA
jgi:CheY-like chemotaxis protein